MTRPIESKSSFLVEIAQGFAKAYADCSEWCQEEADKKNIPPELAQQWIERCKRECRSFQARSPAGNNLFV